MKLTFKQLRPLVATPDDARANMAKLQTVETLALGNSDIAGAQLSHLLQFISISDTPLALRSVDLSRNRLSDAGATALAALLQANASKLPALATLGLFDNGIRDAGALALMRAIEDVAASGHLGELASVALHDNDISTAALRSIDAIWDKLPAARVLSWRHVVLPAESVETRFGDLLKKELGLVTAERIAPISKTLKPLTTLLKRVLWQFVASERKQFEHSYVTLHVFPSLKKSNKVVIPPFIDLEETQVMQDGEAVESVADFLPSSPLLQECVKLIEPERVKALQRLRHNAIKESDPDGLLLPLSNRTADLDALTLEAIDQELDAAHTAIVNADALVDKFRAKDGFRGRYLLLDAFEQDLGMKVRVDVSERSWRFYRSQQREVPLENGASVSTYPDIKPYVVGSSHDTYGSENTHPCCDQRGFELTVVLP